MPFSSTVRHVDKGWIAASAVNGDKEEHVQSHLSVQWLSKICFSLLIMVGGSESGLGLA